MNNPLATSVERPLLREAVVRRAGIFTAVEMRWLVYRKTTA
jgi:hypothetical protein